MDFITLVLAILAALLLLPVGMIVFSVVFGSVIVGIQTYWKSLGRDRIDR